MNNRNLRNIKNLKDNNKCQNKNNIIISLKCQKIVKYHRKITVKYKDKSEII